MKDGGGQLTITVIVKSDGENPEEPLIIQPIPMEGRARTGGARLGSKTVGMDAMHTFWGASKSAQEFTIRWWQSRSGGSPSAFIPVHTHSLDGNRLGSKTRLAR